MFMYQAMPKKQTMRTTLVLLPVLGLGLGTVISISDVVFPQLTQLARAQEDHATALPWITTEKDCRGEARVWSENACWDAEHDASF